MSTLIAVRDAAVTGGEYSPAKEKAANRGVYNGRSPLLHRRIKQSLGGIKFKLLFCLFFLGAFVWLSSKITPFMGWHPHSPSSISSPTRYIFFPIYIKYGFRVCNFSIFLSFNLRTSVRLGDDNHVRTNYSRGILLHFPIGRIK